MPYKYAFKDYEKEHMARNVLLSSSVSTKHCIEIANRIRGKKVPVARRILEETITLKSAIPFKRFKHNIGHKNKIGPGRYPEKACTEVLKALNACEANAQAKGLADLKITHICANMASRPWHYGRARRRKMKRTHIEIVLEETEKKLKKKEQDKGSKEIKKEVKTAQAKKDEKPVEKKKETPKPKIDKKKEGTKLVNKMPAKAKETHDKVKQDGPKKDTGSKDKGI